jgi:hypothetical protein
MNLRVLIGSIALFACLSASANAATLNVVGGQLVGASDVLVGGSLYDVEFLDGTCIDLFTGCDELSDFTFGNGTAADAASVALSEQVFLGGYIPMEIQGCEDQTVCAIATNFNRVTVYTHISQLFVEATESTLPGVASLRVTYDLATNPNRTFARWSPIPEPGTASLLALGLIAMGVRRRR